MAHTATRPWNTLDAARPKLVAPPPVRRKQPPVDMIPPGYTDIKGAATLLAFSVFTVRRLIYAGQLPATKHAMKIAVPDPYDGHRRVVTTEKYLLAIADVRAFIRQKRGCQPGCACKRHKRNNPTRRTGSHRDHKPGCMCRVHMSEALTTHVTFSCNEATRAEMQAEAKRLGVSQSEVFRQAMVEYFMAREQDAATGVG